MAILGMIPFDAKVLQPRASDLAKHLNATIINAGEMDTRRLKNITFCARSGLFIQVCYSWLLVGDIR